MKRLCNEEHYHERDVLNLLAVAWQEGHSAGAMWDHTQHTDETYSPERNPYRGGAA